MTRTFLIAAVVVLIAGSALAQDVAAPRFLIEHIEVRNNERVSSQIILAESLLREGEEYSEADLRDAAARLNRLPFLLSAEFALERGSERGNHVLVITVTETKWFFYRLDLRPIWVEDNDEPGLDFGGGASTARNDGSDAALGLRFFVGRRGAIHGGLFVQDDNRAYTIDDAALMVGYTQYDLFDTRAFATLSVKNSFGALAPQLVVGVPLSLNQTLTLEYDVVRADQDTVQFSTGTFHSGQSQRLITLRWSHNTTDHPFLPTRGSLVHVTPVAAWKDDRHLFREPVGDTFERIPVVIHTRAFGVDFGAARYVPVKDRTTISAGFEAGWAAVDQRRNGVSDSYNATYAIFETGISQSLRSRSDVQSRGDSRLELNLAVTRRSPTRERFGDNDPEDLQITAAWVHRNAWGMVRLGAGLGW